MKNNVDFLGFQKFSFIEQLLFWRGRVQRRDLIEHFKLSESAAAVTFRSYLSIKPGGLVLDRSLKAYTPPPCFAPSFYEPSLAHCELPVLQSGLRVEVPPQTLAALGESIRDKKTLLIGYRSLKGEITQREVAPLSLVRMIDGFPEALCCWCFLRNAIRTFQVPLISSAKIGRPIPKEIAGMKLELGVVSFLGKELTVPKAAIYAVASQLNSVPELRDEAAHDLIQNLANRLEAEWRPLSSSSPIPSSASPALA